MRVSGPANAVASHAVVGGLHMAPALIDASRPQEGLQYGLSPLAVGALLGVPAGAIRGHVVDLADIMGKAAAQLVDRVASSDDWGERFRLVDSALLRRLGATGQVDAALHEAWRLVFASGGRLRVAHVADQVGYSRRHLSEGFRVITGVTPKEAVRIARFEAARGCCCSRSPRHWRGSRPHVAIPISRTSRASGRRWGLQRDDLAARRAPISSRRRGDRRGIVDDMTDTTAPQLPPPAPTVWPSVGFNDVDAGIRLLTEGLGFVVTAMDRGDDGTVEHAEARWPDGGGVMFGSRASRASGAL